MATRARPATPADRLEVFALLQAQLREHSAQPSDAALQAAIDRLLDDPAHGRLLIACVDARPVGVAAVTFGSSIELGGASAWLEELYVVPEHRARGLGTVLVRAALEAAAADGAVAVDLQVEGGHERAANLYRREGFARMQRDTWRRTLAPTAMPARAAATRHTGGCLCGAVRYLAEAAAFDVSHCHCSLCRRSTGAPFVTWATFPASAFAFTGGEPRLRRSTPTASRSFCGECGTALTFRQQERPNSVDVTAGSLDDPESIEPLDHTFTSSRLRWLHFGDELPRFREGNPAESDCPPE